MKGKKLSFKIVLSLLVFAVAGVCFVLSILPKRQIEQVRALHEIAVLGSDNKEYSAMFGGGTIFSVEKVKVNKADEDEDGYPDALSDSPKIFLTGDGSHQYEFFDIGANGKPKTVVQDGGFVRLDNVRNNNEFQMEEGSIYQEALLVSFGVYVYIPKNPSDSESVDKVEIAKNDDVTTTDKDELLYAGITYLKVEATHNGKEITTPAVRNIKPTAEQGGGLYFDFVQLLTQQQDNSNEGYYEYTINYMINYVEYTNTFSFYVLNNTSYTQTIVEEDGLDVSSYGYNARPTAGWTEGDLKGGEFTKSIDSEGYINYYLGNSGITSDNSFSYPTITYDYTRYELTYVHNANRKNTTYSYSVSYSDEEKTYATLICTITDSNGTRTVPYDLIDYNNASTINLVTIMLTEPGSYVANYEYLYDGYNSGGVMRPAFATDTLRLKVHGFNAYYSKENTAGAKMQYFTISSKPANNVDLIIPNGHALTGEENYSAEDVLGFTYVLDTKNNSREGNVVESENVLANYQSEAYSFLINEGSIITEQETISNAIQIANLQTYLDGITYVSTNQTSVWLSGDETWLNKNEESFYYYSASKITANTLFDISDATATRKTDFVKNLYTIETTFKAKGFYLVFIKVNVDSDVDEKEDQRDYYQMFAFEYTSSNIDLKTEVESETEGVYIDLAKGKYTNKEVRISWLTPGVFDRKIEAYYHSSNSNLTEDEMLATNKHTLNTTSANDGRTYAYLGEDVAYNTFERYTIRLESVGGLTKKTFTVDRQPITGIRPYLIQERTSGNSAIYYSYATDHYGEKIAIQNSITDGYATLDWNDKASGASIKVKYSWTSFASADLSTVQKLSGLLGSDWVTTNYQLGSTISGKDLYKSTSTYNVETNCILFDQGIYILDFTDDAGNSCSYAFVIDRTENFFVLNESEFVSNGMLLSGEDVAYSIGDYKAFELNSSSVDARVKEFVEKASVNDVASIKGYYSGINTNATQIANFFQKNGDKYYFTVRNLGVQAYTTTNSLDATVSGIDGILKHDGSDSYYKRTIYAVSENNRYSTYEVKSHSYAIVEINKDNALGMVYYASIPVGTNVPTEGGNSGSMTRLDTDAKIDNAHATSVNHVAFVWNKGSGLFEVEEVSFDFYTLDTAHYSNDELYFYKESTVNTAMSASDIVDLGTRAMYRFNGDSTSSAGLYVVTRKYKGATEENSRTDYGDDLGIRSYYFIVDRNEIIDVSKYIGTNIKLILKEDEVDYLNFSTTGSASSTFSYQKENGDWVEGVRYDLYLQTNRLPAVIQVPTGKYYSSASENSAGYHAGKLKVEVYFKDNYNQFESTRFAGATTKIFDSVKVQDVSKFVKDGMFNIDIKEYLNYVLEDVNFINKITVSGGDGDWIYLPGDYIIRITDNTLSESQLPHEKIIGFRILNENKGPEIDIEYGSKADEMTILEFEDVKNVSVTTSQEFLKVVLPQYSLDPRYAQVDQNYLQISQIIDGVTITNAYAGCSGYIDTQTLASTNSNINIYKDGEGNITSIDVLLDTLLRKGANIDYDNLDRDIKYVITFRYSLNDDFRDGSKYANCYVYYKGGEPVYYYENSYTITIDRKAPSDNIDNLNKTDSLVNDYCEEFAVDSMVENAVIETSRLNFVKQYAKYYQAKSMNVDYKQYLYVYQVYAENLFSTNDISNLYYKQISDIKNYSLSLPFNSASYTSVEITKALVNYGNIGLDSNTYYEIIEQDGAGNVTQYVIHYEPAQASFTLPVVVETIDGETEDISISNRTTDALNVFKIDADGDAVSSFTNDNFFKITLSHNSANFVWLTNSQTNFENLGDVIISKLNEMALSTSGSGNFNLIVKTRTISCNVAIELYNESNILYIYAENTVDKINKVIKLDGANRTDGNGMLFYAKTITIFTNGEEKIYLAKRDQSKVNYYLNGELVNNSIAIEETATYSITVQSAFTAQPADTYRFNLSNPDFIEISFDNNAGYEQTSKNYFGFANATLTFDINIYNSANVIVQKRENATGGYTGYAEAVIGEGIVELLENNTIVEYLVTLTALDTGKAEEYHITIDKRLGSVVLKNSKGETKDIIASVDNVPFDAIINNDKMSSGAMTLSWGEVDNSYFDYVYVIYGKAEDASNYSILQVFDQETSYLVNTQAGWTGLYRLEVRLYKEGEFKAEDLTAGYVANRVYAFEVRRNSNKIYEVRYFIQEGEEFEGDNLNVNPNSIFTMADVTSAFAGTDLEGYVATAIAGINANIYFDLYISNRQLEVTVMDDVEEQVILNEQLEANQFTIIKISKGQYCEYIGILKIASKSSLVKDVQVTGSSTYKISNNTSLILAENKSQSIDLKASITNVGNALLAKNKLQLEVYYNLDTVELDENKLVKVVDFNGMFNIAGNGQYTFVIKDLSGNVHVYENLSKTLAVNVIKNVTLTINGEAPVENAIYNNEVTLVVYGSALYNPGTVDVKAYRNGNPYSPEGQNPTYKFSAYGNYRVVVTAEYGTTTYSAVTYFTILNIKEARTSIDLTAMSGHELTKVINPTGAEVTNAFKNMMNSVNYGGTSVSYDGVMAYAKQLGVVSGKISFNLTYKVTDDLYPNRTLNFSFTLNNEVPKIQCTLGYGESTKKSFDIFFNPSIIYEQVGDAGVYINGNLVCEINENSANEEVRITSSFKQNGDGDYYISLISSSGVIIDSYKVTIKEPLNAWAIVVIVAVVAVVATIATIIIVLRRKMKIR